MTDVDDRRCACCRRSQPDLGMACRRCRDRAEQMLNEILDHVALAEAELELGRGGAGRSAGRTLGLRIDALDVVAGFDVLPELESWERDWREMRQFAPIPDRCTVAGLPHAPTSLAAVVEFLLVHLSWAYAEHPAVDEFHRELKTVHAHSEQAARISRPRVHVVTCPTDVGDGRCGNRLVLTQPDLEDHVRCAECSTTWTVRRLLLVAASDSEAEVWVAEADVALIHGVSGRVLRKWAQAGRVQRKRGMYELGSVRAEIAEALAQGRFGDGRRAG